MSYDMIYMVVGMLFFLLSYLLGGAAYRNGVTDGYDYAREPRNPGYQRAGNYLRKCMGHRWPELVARRPLVIERDFPREVYPNEDYE